ncbi:unnamed protein product, partial [Polarella glacialis]
NVQTATQGNQRRVAGITATGGRDQGCDRSAHEGTHRSDLPAAQPMTRPVPLVPLVPPVAPGATGGRRGIAGRASAGQFGPAGSSKSSGTEPGSLKRPPELPVDLPTAARSQNSDGQTQTAKRLRPGTLATLELPKQDYAAPSSAVVWEVLRPTELLSAPRVQGVSGSLGAGPAPGNSRLRTLRVGERVQQIGQRPAEGTSPDWLAIAPRGWVKVETDPAPNVAKVQTRSS